MVGVVDQGGTRLELDADRVRPWEELRVDCARHNRALVEHLREDPHGDELWRLTQEDAAKGRMTRPVLVEAFATEHVRLHPRFGVEQAKADGELSSAQLITCPGLLAQAARRTA